MKKKKFIVIGKGTAGGISAAHFNHHLSENEWEIEWHYDPNIPTQAVGEGLNLTPPINLSNTIEFSPRHLKHVDGSFKSGIEKKNWGKKENCKQNYFHPFDPAVLVSWHINAVKMQDYCLEYLKNNSNVKIVEQNSDLSKLDADHILVCSGRPTPKQLNQEYVIADYIPVNAVHVVQCMWDFPQFQYSLTNAHEGGWYFGIPLQNRCAIGMMYNTNFNTLDQIKEMVKPILEENGLTPSDKTNSFSFTNYYRNRTFYDNITYNGNSSFFLEPLEATTIGQVVSINKELSTFLNRKHISIEEMNLKYVQTTEETAAMIMLHYYAGSAFNNSFWDFAEQNSKQFLERMYNTNNAIRAVIDIISEFSFNQFKDDPIRIINYLANKDKNPYDVKKAKLGLVNNIGSWGLPSWFLNVHGLGIRDKLKNQFYGK